ncbi:MAG TPA: glycoside hydrolase family 15 protein [Noviherbaspirillum sp.]
MHRSDHPYPPIEDYALISDCHCTALVSRDGSIDWCCMPRIDDDSCFGRLLDWRKGGYFSIAPVEDYTSTRGYVPRTMILETHFRTAQGEFRLYDFFAMDGGPVEHARYDHVRILEGIAGEVEVRVEVSPRFDYGEIVPYIRHHAEGIYTATGSNQGLIIDSQIPLEVVQHRDLAATFTLQAGQRLRMVAQFQFPELVDKTLAAGLPGPDEIDEFFERTRRWWQDWTNRMRSPYELDAQTVRSTITLKSLTFERTGAIVAATTTSLPEWIGGERNWDYRFSWIRDSVFTVRALNELGFVTEADRFHQFIQRSAAGDADQMQIMYGVDGKRRLTEIELHTLEGYRGSRPVRIGNGAASQSQLDVYGELLEMAWEWHASGHGTEPDYWAFLVDVVEMVCRRWREADHGIWEVRGAPRHFVHSKVMCWAALNRGVLLAQENGLDAPVDHWIAVREELRATIEREGYDARRGVFVQAFGNAYLDSALLLLPRVGFVAFDDPRMLRTVDAICDALDHKGLLLRYNSPDGLPGPEGVFIPCTFWLVMCLAHQGKTAQARRYYENALACANDIGLFSEEFDTEGQHMLGNFPQGLTHVSQIMAKLALDKAGKTAAGK